MNNEDKKIKIKKPFIGITFKCCNVYSRIYLNRKGNAFVGWCPKCAGKTKVNVSKSGNKSRFFTVE